MLAPVDMSRILQHPSGWVDLSHLRPRRHLEKPNAITNLRLNHEYVWICMNMCEFDPCLSSHHCAIWVEKHHRISSKQLVSHFHLGSRGRKGCERVRIDWWSAMRDPQIHVLKPHSSDHTWTNMSSLAIVQLQDPKSGLVFQSVSTQPTSLP